jgi:hypothetical protein
MAEKMLNSTEDLLSETLYDQYCSAFDQLIEVANNEPENVDHDKLEDMRLVLIALEKRFAEEQQKLQDVISVERLKKQTRRLYKQSKFKNGGYDKTT